MASNLSREEVVEYLNNRQAKGFNAFSFNLVEHFYSRHTPPWLNVYGHAAFDVTGDFSTPNDDLGKLAGPNVRCRWYDPTNGAYRNIGTFLASGLRAFSTIGNNAGGHSDWILLVESAA